MMPAARGSLSLDLTCALTSTIRNRDSTDFTIYCRGKTYPVHTSVLRARSDFFDGVCRNPFKESQRGYIDLSADDPEAVEHMITYFYSLDYLCSPQSRHARGPSADFQQPQTPSLCSTPSSPLSPMSPTTPTFSRQRRLKLSMVEDPLLAIASDNMPKRPASPYLTRFGINSPLAPPDMPHLFAVKPIDGPWPTMDTMIRENLREEVFDEGSVPEQETDYRFANLVLHAKVYAIAEQYGIPGLKILAKRKYAAQVTYHRESSEFATSLLEVYDGTVESDRGLRDIAISMFRRFPELAQRADIEAVARETAPLAWELFRIAWGLPI